MKTISMTGYGIAEGSCGNAQITVEARSVNQRFLDVVCKLPQPYYSCEQELIRIVRDRLKRGRVEILVGRKDMQGQDYELAFNEQLFAGYLEIGKRALAIAGLASEQGLAEVVVDALHRREVLEMAAAQAKPEEELAKLQELTAEAVAKLLEMRKSEGSALEQQIIGYLSAIEQIRQQIAGLAGTSAQEFKERLAARLNKLSPNVGIEESRLAQEVVILADRVDISEEIIRLQSHLEQFRQTIANGEGGRKMEFLLQEIMREINTSGSKVENSTITNLVVEAKTIVEKIREQVQNIE